MHSVSSLAAGSAIRHVAVIGAGAGGPVSGATLALMCGRAGFSTVLEDVLPGNLRRAAAFIDSVSPEFVPRYATSIEDAVRDVDLVIDTVPDELESKLEILSLLDRMAPPHALFATPTEVLSIADLASCTYRAGQCFALRFLSLPLPEQLITGSMFQVVLSYPPACLPVTRARMQAFLEAFGAEVEIAEDIRPLP